MIDFTNVTREFRSLVDRRRDIQTFLGSGFAAMSVFLFNVLEGKLPPSLRSIQEHVFTFYALILLVLSLLLSLRMARLHGGLVLNGVLYARVLQASGRPADPQRAARHNLLGVSFLQFILVDLIAAFSAAILLLARDRPMFVAAGVGAGVFGMWMALYFWFHARAARFALEKARTDDVGPAPVAELREHLSLSLHQANQGLITEIAFAGLMVFSGFGALSGLGKIEAAQTDLTPDFVRANGPIWFAGLMTITCLFELVIYLRVRIAIGKFSLQLDPTDRPYRPLRLTDSLLGYLLLAFLFAVSLHVLLVQVLNVPVATVLAIDTSAFLLAVAAEQLTLVAAGRDRPAAVAAATTERPG